MNWSSVVNFFRNPDAGAPTPGLDPTVRLLRGAAMDAQRSRLPQMAAALSYRTIFGLVPMLAVGLWILHRMVTPEELKDYIGRAIDALGLSSIVVDTHRGDDVLIGPPMPPMTPAPEGTAESVDSLQRWITELVARINNISFSAIGIAGIVMLIYAAISMIVEIERAFNQIFRVPRGRSWVRRVVNYWTLITLGSIGLVATFGIQRQFGEFIREWTGGNVGIGSGAITLQIVGFATQWLISTAVLLLLYTAVPNTKVRFLPALYGAMLAAATFEASKFGFAQYVEFSAGLKFSRLYGSLALIPLFLLWVYFSWLIVLFGVQLTYRIQHGAARTRAQPIMEMSPTLVEPTAALLVMSSIARAFAAGRTLDAPAIARQTRLADPVVRLVLGTLCERGLLHRVDDHGAGNGAPPGEAGECAYALARPPSTIRIGELLAVGFQLAGGDPDDPVLAKLRQAQVTAAGDETLADALSATGSIAAGDHREGAPAARDIAGSLLRPPPARPGQA